MGERKTDCKNGSPKVSVIMPVYNTEKYLRESLDSLLAQTFSDFEIICVDDGSTDQSPAILEEYAQKDTRMKVLRQENRGAGAARNLGFSHATGTYAYFFDADDLCSPELLEKTVARAEETKADIVAFDFIRFHEDGTVENRVGIHADWLPPETEVFSYRDCPDRIMSIINPTPWNKLYRASFISQRGLAFDEISSTNDIAFCAVSAACAERITFIQKPFLQYRVGHSNTISSTKMYKLNNVITAVQSAVRQASAQCPNSIQKSINRFAIDNYIGALNNYVKDFELTVCKEYYNHIHQYFCSEQFADVQQEDFNSKNLWLSFCTVRKHDYVNMRTLRSRKLIVSLTTFPFRINCIPTVLESIYKQTHQPDQIILYLAESQFPGKMSDLPDALCELVREGRLDIRWCADDLKPHKKYYYAMQEFPDDLIVTIDDDLLYAPDMLETLYQSYLLYPDAVSTVRAHLITVSETGEVLPYKYWAKEVDGFLNQPSMYLMATGGAGVLYPPKLMSSDLFNKQAILSTCLMADDLWLKTMQLLNDVPVVVACEYQGLHYIDGSQEVGLRYTNVDCDENDVQLEKINRWLEKHYEKGIWVKKLTVPGHGEDLSGIRKVCEIFTQEREQNRRNLRVVNRRLQQTYAEKSELNRKLQRTYAEKSELNRKLQITYDEKFDRGVQIKELNAQLKAAKKAQADLKKQLKTAKKQNTAIKRSTSYRLGRILTWPVRKLKGLLRGLRKEKKQN